MDQLKQQGRQRWNEVLGKIEVEDESIDHLRTFYSCLYRSLLFPRAFYEKDAAGEIVHYSPYNGTVQKGYMFTDTGFWDTFRCLFPLLNLMYPSENVKIQEGLANTYKESGFLPEWASPGHRGCMVGNNSASVVADAYLSGLRGYDMETLWQAVVHGTQAVHPQVNSTGRLGYEYYNKLGYVPYDVKINESVARTLEYAYDDWCIYQLGKALGKSAKELKPFAKRAMNYQKVFDKETKLMRGRLKDGKFMSPFNPLKWGDAFTEGNAWHYTHGNQPIQHAIYLYGYSGQPWKTQYWIRQVMDKLYTPAPDGYCGDEDNGQTSAWYVFSAMGFYPVCPGSGQYVLGTPYFKSMKLHLENGKEVDIQSEGKGCYVDEMLLNGNSYQHNYLDMNSLMQGTQITYRLSEQPNLQRGTQEDDIPYSFSRK